MTTTIRITEETRTPGKVAEAELHFAGGILDGLKMIGFAVWTRRGNAGFNVTFPARQYAVNGERRSFALLRPSNADTTTTERIRDLIVDAYTRSEQHPDVRTWTYDDDGRCTTTPPSSTTEDRRTPAETARPAVTSTQTTAGLF